MKTKSATPSFLCLFIIICCLLSTALFADRDVSLQKDRSVEGIIKPFRESTLSTSLIGRINNIPVKEGDIVEGKQVLLVMDDQLETLEVSRRLLQMQDKSEVELAQKKAEIMREEIESTRELFNRAKTISREDLNRKEVEAGVAEADLKKLQNREILEEIEWKMASEQLERRHVKAPFPGMVTDVYVEEGEVSQAGQPLVRLVDISKCYLECYLSASQFARLEEEASTVFILVPKHNKLIQIEAGIDHISSVVDPASGLRKVRVIFQNDSLAITAGLTGYLVLGPER